MTTTGSLASIPLEAIRAGKSTEIRYCSDCKWCRPANYSDQRSQFYYARCARPDLKKPADPSNEFVHPLFAADLPYCSSGRMSECGESGRFFEPRNG